MQNYFIKSLIEWIDSNKDKNISTSDVVQRSGYSSTQLQRIFKSTFGCSINDFITNKKMYRIALALKFTNMSIHDIAISSGFSSIHSFSKSFRNVYGTTPSKYREGGGVNFTDFFSWQPKQLMDLSSCTIEYEYVSNFKLYGVKSIYMIDMDNLGLTHKSSRDPIKMSYCQKHAKERIYTLSRPFKSEANFLPFEYHIGNPLSDGDAIIGDELPKIDGHYLKFKFVDIDPAKGYFIHAAIAYWGVMAENNLSRSNGYDLEIIDFNDTSTYITYIPVMFNDELIDYLANQKR